MDRAGVSRVNMIVKQRSDWSELYNSIEPPIPDPINPDWLDEPEDGNEEED